MEPATRKNNKTGDINPEKADQDWFGKFRGVGRFSEEDELDVHND